MTGPAPQPSRRPFALALLFSLSLHALLLPGGWRTPVALEPEPLEVRFETRVPALSVPPELVPPQPQPQPQPRPARPVPAAPDPAAIVMEPVADTAELVATPPLSLAAPDAPSAEQWQLASTYTLRNSKRYRHAWGQQVRSMMGTAVEGPGQGMVRFRIEIAPNGRVARIDEIWTTSEHVSKLARKAIEALPPLPPTPTGAPLVFEQTISFMPYETGWPPSYRLDCLPEVAAFANPYAWNGTGAPQVVARGHRPPPPEGCPPDSTEDTIEAEEQSFERQMDQWRWAR